MRCCFTSVLATLCEMLMFASEDMHKAYGWGKGIVRQIRAMWNQYKAQWPTQGDVNARHQPCRIVLPVLSGVREQS